MHDECTKKPAARRARGTVKVDRDILGSAATVAALLKYQPKSIVSRTLVDSPSCTVTLFAFDAGQGLSEHSAPFNAMVHVLDGEARITIGGKPQRMKAGALVVMPANIPHAVKALKRFKMLLTMARE